MGKAIEDGDAKTSREVSGSLATTEMEPALLLEIIGTLDIGYLGY